MRKVFSVALMATLACVFGLSANAGVTVDVIFQDTGTSALDVPITSPTGTGCAFGGYSGGSVSTGYCMDVILTSTHDMTVVSTSVSYDNTNGLAIASMYEWKGPIVSPGRIPTQCVNVGGLVDQGGVIESFDCGISFPNNPPVLAAGTYRVGTIIWDATGGAISSNAISAVINDLFDGVGAVINGNVVFLGSGDIVVNPGSLNIIPEPGTASLLGLGLVGLILAGRRSRA